MTQICKLSVAQHESDLLSVVHSLIRSMNETNLQVMNSGPCYASCIRFYLVKLMRLSGYDAGVCASKWQGSGKVPGGMPQCSLLYSVVHSIVPQSHAHVFAYAFISAHVCLLKLVAQVITNILMLWLMIILEAQSD